MLTILNNILQISKNLKTSKVTKSDTLSGIAIRYNTSIQLIKKHNIMIGDHFNHLTELMIPRNNSTSPKVVVVDKKLAERQKTRSFMKATGAPRHEATYYLGEYSESLNYAISKWKEEAVFDRK